MLFTLHLKHSSLWPSPYDLWHAINVLAVSVCSLFLSRYVTTTISMGPYSSNRRDRLRCEWCKDKDSSTILAKFLSLFSNWIKQAQHDFITLFITAMATCGWSLNLQSVFLSRLKIGIIKLKFFGIRAWFASTSCLSASPTCNSIFIWKN